MQLQHVSQDGSAVVYLDGGPVRCWMEEGQPCWFASSDLGKAVGLSQPRVSNILKELADDDKGIRETNTLGGKQSLTVLSRSGVYQVIAQLQDKEVGRRLRKQMADLTVAYETGKLSAPTSLDQDRILTRLAYLEAKLDGIMLGIAASRRPAPTRKRNENPRPQSAGYLSVNKWFETNLLIGEGEVPAMVAYQHYCQWASRQGQKPTSQNIFGRTITALGIGKRRTREFFLYEGVQLLQILGSRL